MRIFYTIKMGYVTLAGGMAAINILGLYQITTTKLKMKSTSARTSNETWQHENTLL